LQPKVEVSVADEDADDLARGVDEAVERRRVRQRGTPPQQLAEGNPGEVGIDEQGLVLAADAVAGDPEPFDLQAIGQLQRLCLELSHGLAVFALGGAPAQLCLGEVAEVSQGARHERYAVATVAESLGVRAIVCRTTQ
jgi:hypothetical protein